MGTRNLTAVKIDGQYKVAQYGQWDGYPEGQGMTCLHFLREKMDADQFKQSLRKASFIDPKDLNALWKEYGADDNGMVSLDDMDRMKRDHPEFSRDTGAEILELVQNHPEGMQLQDELEFAADGLFCEWAWVIDFDTGTFEAFTGYNRTKPLTPEDRFYFLRDKEDDGYHGVTLVAKWSLDSLPSDEDFIAAFKTDDEEKAEVSKA